MKLALEVELTHKILQIITDKSSSYIKHVNNVKDIVNLKKKNRDQG